MEILKKIFYPSLDEVNDRFNNFMLIICRFEDNPFSIINKYYLTRFIFTFSLFLFLNVWNRKKYIL